MSVPVVLLPDTVIEQQEPDMYLKDVPVEEMKGQKVLSATGKSGMVTNVSRGNDTKITIRWENEGPADVFLSWEQANPLIEVAPLDEDEED